MKMLIVDDERLILAGLKHMVERIGTPFVEILTAQSGEEALSLMERERPQLVLTDVAMPGMTGLEMIERAMQADLCRRFIIISGRQDFAFVQQALRNGVMDYLLKPVDREELRTLILRCAEEIRKESPKSGTRNPYVLSACALIREKYAGPLTLPEVAAQLNLHPNYLSSLFSRETGMTFSGFLMQCRIEQAKHLLREYPHMNTDQVGELSGFREPRQFFKAFKAVTGMTPRQYARKQ